VVARTTVSGAIVVQSDKGVRFTGRGDARDLAPGDACTFDIAQAPGSSIRVAWNVCPLTREVA
jgi:hypothetical protein